MKKDSKKQKKEKINVEKDVKTVPGHFTTENANAVSQNSETKEENLTKENSGKKKNLDKINLRLIHQKGRNLLLFQNFHHLKNNSKKTKKSVKTKAQAKTMKAHQRVQKALIPVQVRAKVKTEAVQ